MALDPGILPGPPRRRAKAYAPPSNRRQACRRKTVRSGRFGERLELAERNLPLPADDLERPSRLLDLRRVELPEALAPGLHVTDDARVRKDLQMLRDALTGDVGVG